MIDNIYEKTEADMLSALNSLNNTLHKIRAGRITLKIFDSILVECYQKFINLNQLSSIVIINNNSVKITPWIKVIYKA